MRYWLMKSEPGDVSIDDLAALPDQTVAWYGVRNYQARNFMRDQMKVGDGVLFYHSNCKEPGIAGIARVSSTAYPDATQFKRNGSRRSRVSPSMNCAITRNWNACAPCSAATACPSRRSIRPSGNSSPPI